VSPSCFEFVAWTHARLLESYQNQIFPLSVVLDKKYMKLHIGKVVDHTTWGSCTPTDSVKNGDDYSILIHNIGTGVYIDSNKTNWHTWLVKVMKCRVGVIRVKKGQGEEWITICIGIIVTVIHITIPDTIFSF